MATSYLISCYVFRPGWENLELDVGAAALYDVAELVGRPYWNAIYLGYDVTDVQTALLVGGAVRSDSDHSQLVSAILVTDGDTLQQETSVNN